MKKNKLLLGSFAGTFAAATPMFAVSCGSAEFDDTREELLFHVTFSSGREQFKALEGVIEKYNEVVAQEKEAAQAAVTALKTKLEAEKDKTKKAELQIQLDEAVKNVRTYMRVSLKNNGSGYGAGHNNLFSSLTNKDVKSIPNMTINYGSTISEIVERERGVDLSDAKAFGDLALSRDLFETRFASTNDKIQGVKPGLNYSLPFLKSTVAFGINGPVYKYVLKTLKDNGFTIAESLLTKFKVDAEDFNADVEIIKGENYFGAAKDQAKINEIFTANKYPNKTIGENVFTEFKTYIQFITDAIQIFQTSSDKDKSTVALLGIDDPSGILNTVVYSKLSGDDSNMLMAVDTDAEGKVVVKFDSIKDANSEAYKANQEVFNLITKAISVGAIKIYGGGSYSSTDQVVHKTGASFGSTAGYKYNYIDAQNVKPNVEFLDVLDQKSKKPKHSISVQNVGTVKTVKEKKVLSFAFDNEFIKSTETTKDRFYYQTQAADDALVDTLKALPETQYLIKVDVADTALLAKVDEYAGTEATKLFEKLGVITEFEKGKDAPKQKAQWAIYKFKKATAEKVEGKYQVNVPTIADTLQKDELITFIPPQKYDASSTKLTSFLQGPNLYVINNGEIQNKATLRFLNFVFKDKTPRDYKFGKKTKQVSNLAFISETASYIIPYKGFAQDNALEKARQENKYLDEAFKLFADEKVTWYEEPTSKWSNSFREVFNSTYQTVSKSIRENGTEQTFELLATNLKAATVNFK
ncbi:P68 family surface lipoprotein [Mycoplasma simbae]|uniref:P68 family surface lipoprotein n=1 Tax=Mycoplasma simbae TaxID=36744 RepID=UPI00049510E0|nr:P80 family lipoprotein [Mycoplasma simbae]